MRQYLLAAILFLLASIAAAQPLVQPFDFVMPTYDSTRSDWLPQMPAGSAGAHGFLKRSSDGHLEFEDGTPVRFTGTGLMLKSCFPDSLLAIATANRLQKLGINMVRFAILDYSYYEPYSTIAAGTRSDTLSPVQMRKLDFFLYQLKQRGIYAHFVLKSLNAPRRDDGVPGWDSVYGYTRYLAPFSEPIRRMEQRYMSALFNHRNEFTGMKYADDPTIALVTVAELNSPYYYWLVDYLSPKPGILSYQHSRMIDTLYSNFLRRRYGTTAALKAAYWEGSKVVGPNMLMNPGFESFASDWTLLSGEGTSASAVIVQGPDVPPTDGANSMRVVINRSNGSATGIYLYQSGMPLHRNHIYRLRFKAKTDTAVGKSIRVIVAQGTGYGYAFDTTVTVSNTWQAFTATFRAPGVDSIATALYIFAGASVADLFLDGFELQETGRDGLGAGESLENYTIGRAVFRLARTYSRQRVIDQGSFYDSLARNYYRAMHSHLRSLGVRVPIAGTNYSVSAADTWVQSEFDFTSTRIFWDNFTARAGLPTSDSTWVINNYSVLNYRDQVIPYLTRSAIAGKPFIAEAYAHVFPNAHRSEMMLFYPAYAMLQDWDGVYFYLYNDGVNDTIDRRSIMKGDHWSIISDPSMCALMPQVAAIIRNGWIAPAQRAINIQHDETELRELPLTYYTANNNPHNIDISDGSSLDNAVTMVSRVRLDSFNASRRYTGNDYYSAAPADDNIQSDTRQIVRDATKGVMTVNTPMAQGGSGAIANVASLRTDDLRVSWIDGAQHVTYLWTSLDTAPLKTARRSLLTVTTRAMNTGALWQFGDSSLGKNWGGAPVQMESVELGVNFSTDADSLFLYPLDTMGRSTGKEIAATRMVDSWRVTLDLSVERTPWFGVRQGYREPGLGVEIGEDVASVGEIHPNPARDEAMVEIGVPMDVRRISIAIIDAIGRPIRSIALDARPGRSMLPLDLREMPSGSYTCVVSMGGRSVARRLLVVR